jgi:hypothetical protein
MVLISLVFKQDVVLAVIQLKVGVVMLPLQRLSILPISELTLDLNSCYAVQVSLGRARFEVQLPDLEDRRLILRRGCNLLARLFLVATRRQALVVHLYGPVLARRRIFFVRGMLPFTFLLG